MRKDNGEPHWPLTGMITRVCGGEELAPHPQVGTCRGGCCTSCSSRCKERGPETKCCQQKFVEER